MLESIVRQGLMQQVAAPTNSSHAALNTSKGATRHLKKFCLRRGIFGAIFANCVLICDAALVVRSTFADRVDPALPLHSFAPATMFRSALFPDGSFNRQRNSRGSPTELWGLYARVLRRTRVKS